VNGSPLIMETDAEKGCVGCFALGILIAHIFSPFRAILFFNLLTPIILKTSLSFSPAPKDLHGPVCHAVLRHSGEQCQAGI